VVDIEPSPKSHAYVSGASPPVALPTKFTVSGAPEPDHDAAAIAVGVVFDATVIVTWSVPCDPSMSVTMHVATYVPGVT
jgi:hypothetical protein